MSRRNFWANDGAGPAAGCSGGLHPETIVKPRAEGLLTVTRALQTRFAIQGQQTLTLFNLGSKNAISRVTLRSHSAHST